LPGVGLAISSSEIVSDKTADITRCFEEIPIQPEADYSLPEALEHTLGLAFEFYAELHGQRRRTPKMWIRYRPSDQTCSAAVFSSSKPGSSGTWISFTQKELQQLYQEVLGFGVVCQGGLVYQQHVGVPMGLSCSPEFVNLYGLSYEWRAVERVRQLDAGQTRKAKLAAFQHLYRLMDDVRIVNGAALHPLIFEPVGQGDPSSTGWIYPPCVQIKDTTGESGDTVYLDIHTRHGSSGYTMQTFRKESKLPFEPIKYTAFASNRPTVAGYNGIIGLVRSAVYHASGAAKAAKDIFSIVKSYQHNGYDRQKLLAIARRTVTEGQFPGVRFDTEGVARFLR
jgi:hypothetical protein